MHVTCVKLKNIKSYEEAVFDFQKGTTAIIGANGAGKTTILQAIGWALFDSLKSGQAEFVRRGAKRGEVRVTFESGLDKRLYEVVRTTSGSYYVYDAQRNIRVVEQTNNVLPFLKRHFAVDELTELRRLFESAVGVAQGLLTASFVANESERKKTFDSLLRVDEYRASVEKMRDAVRLIKDRLETLGQEVARAEGELGVYDDLKREHTGLKRDIAEQEKSLTASADKIQTYAALVTEYESKKNLWLTAQTHLEQLRNQLAFAHSAAEQASDNVARAEQAQALQQQNLAAYELHGSAQQLSGELKDKSQQRDQLRDRQRQQGTTRHRLTNDLDSLRERSEEACQAARTIGELGPAISQQDALEKQIKELDKHLADAGSAEKNAARLQTEIEGLRSSYRTAQENVRRATAAQEEAAGYEELRSTTERLERLRGTLQSAATNLGKQRQQYQQAERELNRTKRRLSDLEKVASDLELEAFGHGTLEADEQRWEALRDQLATLRATIDKDETMQAQMRNGLCPILTQRCLNIPEGETLEDYFTLQLGTNRATQRQTEVSFGQLSTSLAATRRARQAAERLPDVQSNLDDTRSEHTERTQNVATLAAQIAELEEEVAQTAEVESELAELQRRTASAFDAKCLADQLSAFAERLESLGAEGETKRNLLREFKLQAQQRDGLEGEMDAAQFELKQLNNPRQRVEVLGKVAGRQEGLEEQIRVKEAELTGVEREERRLGQELGVFGELDAEIAANNQQLRETRNGYEDYRTYSVIAAELPARLAKEAEAVAHRTTTAEQVSQAEGEFERVAQAYDATGHQDAQANLSAAQSAHAATEATLRNQRERRSRVTEQIHHLDGVHEEMTEKIKERKHFERVQQTTQYVRDLLGQAAPQITETYIANISIEANLLFREITGDAERTLRWTNTYDIVLEEDGHERSFGLLSGGEQAVAALAVRMALLKQLSGVRLAFFDEPTVNIDTERRANLAQQIRGIKNFDQLFVISHDETFESVTDSVVNVPFDGLTSVGSGVGEG